MVTFVGDLISRIGYFGVFLLMALENIFPPIPSEVIMPFAGFVVSQGKLNFGFVLWLGLRAPSLGRYRGTSQGSGWAQKGCKDSQESTGVGLPFRRKKSRNLSMRLTAMAKKLFCLVGSFLQYARLFPFPPESWR